MTINVIPYRKIFYLISIILVVASIISLFVWGLKLGIDFTGGSLLEVEFSASAEASADRQKDLSSVVESDSTKEGRPSNEQIKNVLADSNLGEINMQPVGEKSVILRFKHIDEATHIDIVQKLGTLQEVDEKRFESIGPMIGQELKKKAISAIFLVLVMIIFFIAWAFRQVSKPVSSFYYGIAAIVALFHDVIIPPGIFAVLGHFRGAEINLLFITGLLTILGFSVHDTIVVFDRIRENLRKGYFKDFETTVNESIKQTFSRSISTSLTVLFAVIAIYFFGGETTKHFALLLIFGLFFGTYSSIFIASPLLVSWEKFRSSRKPR